MGGSLAPRPAQMAGQFLPLSPSTCADPSGMQDPEVDTDAAPASLQPKVRLRVGFVGYCTGPIFPFGNGFVLDSWLIFPEHLPFSPGGV